MTLFQFRWLRRLIRRNTSPIAEDKAKLWKQRLSVGYMILTWNALGAIIYLYATGKSDLASYYGLKTEKEQTQKPAEYFAELLNVKKARVISMKGFHKVGEYDIENKKDI